MSRKDKLYIMQCNNYIKIGVSKNPERRIKSLQTGNPYKIKLILAIEDSAAYDLEYQFHKYYEKEKSVGEWFEINDNIRNFVKNLKIKEYRDAGGIG
jgi:predicted GIY-YIG superfamily endonuclease